MDEKCIDSLELKKKILFPHLEFVKEMLLKVKGNSIEEKWKIMYECITSDKKRPSYEKIKQMEKTLIALKNQSKQKSNVPQNNSESSTSKTKIIPKDSKTSTNIMERDPRKRIAIDQSSTAIYNLSPFRNDNQSPRFEQKSENERPFSRWSDRPSNAPTNSDKCSRNFQESFRGRGRGRGYSRGRAFTRHPDDLRYRLNQRRSSPTLSERPQFRDDRNRSLNKDDLNFKRKRSQSPESRNIHEKPKRRYSLYQTSGSTEINDSEKLKRQSLIDNTKYSTDKGSNSKSVNTETKPSSSKTVTPTSKLDKVKIDKKETETSVPVDLAEAIKKIQGIRIPKLGLNKNASKIDLATKSNDDENKKSTINTSNKIRNKNLQENISKDEKMKPKTNEKSVTLEKETKAKKIQSIISQNESESVKNSETNTHEMQKHDSKEFSDETNQKNDDMIIDEQSNLIITNIVEIEDENEECIEIIHDEKDEIKPSSDEDIWEIVGEAEYLETSESIPSNSKPSECVEPEVLDKCSDKLNDLMNEEVMAADSIENDTMKLDYINEEDKSKNQAVEFKNSLLVDEDKIEANKIDEPESSKDDEDASSSKIEDFKGETPIIEELNHSKDHEEPTTSIVSNTSNQKATALTNLLDNEEEDPEKVLEGLISVLGAEKVKKMQELLLKNSIKTKNIPNSNTEDNFSEANEKTELKGNEKQKNILTEDKTDRQIQTALPDNETITASKVVNDQEETEKIESVQVDSSKTEIQKATIKSPTKIKTNSSSCENKTKKPRKKKLTELDKLHENILSSIDCEGIMRACGQPRVSIKPKVVEVQNSTIKNQETKPCIVKLLRLNLTVDNMAIQLNDEFYQKYLTIQETKSRTKPKSRKRSTISQEKPIIKVPKLESEFKSEPTSSAVITEVPVEESQKPLQKLNEGKAENNVKVETKVKKDIKLKKKKHKLLSWSKGILKKKPKRFKVSNLYEWEDVDSSDDNINYDRSMKLKTFRNILGTFANKCGYKKMSKKIPKIDHQKNEIFEDTHFTVDEANLTKNDENSAVNENDSLFVIPKKINLPIEKNLLNKISKTTNSEINSSINNVKSPNLKITIKLPTLEKSVQSFSPTIQQTQQSDTLTAGPSNENNTKIYSSQSNPQKVVIVKPLSKEIGNDAKVISLSAQEQQAIKDALASKKNQQPATSIAQQSNEIIMNMLTNLKSSINITKISTQKATNVSSSKDEPTRKSLPIISNVESISPKQPTSQQKSSSKVLNITSKIASIKSTAPLPVKSSATLNDKPPKTTENVIASSSKNPTFLPNLETNKKESTSESRESTESIEISTTNEPVEVVDLIDDDDDDEIVDIMRPWIEKADFKSRKEYFEAIKMINNVHCLASLYKCMGSTCSYFTNDKTLFQKHLELHQVHQKHDSQNYLLCCYCSFRPKTINVLLVHIENAHSYGKFGCKYCFYRSINEYQVTANHHSNFHRLKEKAVVEFEPRKIKNENLEKSVISESIPKVCHALPCPYCNIGIYTIAEFEAHVSSHREQFTTVCIKCNQTTTKLNISHHLLKCFNKFGNFQCVFCVFGTSIFSAIDNHLATEHPDKLSYFAERSLSAGKESTTVESLTTKELSKRITGTVRKIHLKYKFNDEVYKNAGSVGRLAENFVIDPATLPEPSSSDSSSFLQIGNVISLHD